MSKRPFRPLLVCLTILPGIELWSVLQQHAAMHDALLSALLVFSFMGFICVCAALPGRPSPLQRATRRLLGLVMGATASVLFMTWLTFWITGRPLNADAIGVLTGSPLAATLHLLSSDPLLFSCIAAGLCIVLWGGSWLVRHASHAQLQARKSLQVLVCLLLGTVAAYAATEVARVSGSRSSFAVLLGSPVSTGTTYQTYACPRSPEIALTTPAAGKPGNGSPVVVMMIESLRADLLDYHSDAIPNIAHLAGEALVFERAYTTSSHSDYADLAFWYSRHPLRAERRKGYPKDAPWRGISAFEYFKLHGYSTAYFSSQNEKWGDMINWLKIPAVDTYFDSENFTGETWENEDDSAGLIRLIRAGIARSGKVEDSRTLGFAADWAESHAGKPFFLGLNLQNTHYHYYIPEGGHRPFLPDELGFRAVYAAWPRDKVEAVRNRYLNAAYNMDAAVGQFIARLQRAGIWDKAVVLIVGDSGEGFYEHGYSNHSGPLYEEIARTLALVKLPKGDPRNGQSWDQPVSHVDLVPAIVDLAGLDEWPGFQGSAPWSTVNGSAIYMTANALAREDSAVHWPWKVMLRRFPEQGVELYNLLEDPGETRNLADAQPTIAFRLLRDLESWRTCQLSYYADERAYSRVQPPRYPQAD